MDAIFHRLIENNFSELPGMAIDASIPVPEPLANELIAEALQSNKNIEYCRISIGDQNRISVNLKTPLWPWPFQLKLKLFRSVDFSGSPKVRAFLENYAFLGKLGLLFKALPDEITFYKDQVSVDLGAYLQSAQQKRLLELIESVEIQTRPGMLILDVKARAGGHPPEIQTIPAPIR